jgi:hypothetical protein
LQVSGDRYEESGTALVEIAKEADCYRFSWEASDSAGTAIASDARAVFFAAMDDPRKPHAYLESYIRTHIQKTRLKRKNKLKVVEWTWLER